MKYKINQSQEFVIGGYTPGNPFDALIVGVYDGAALNFVAKVRAGFVLHSRREVFKRFDGLKIDKCPFANLPEKRRTMWALTADEMKECTWLKPKLVVQIEFQEWISGLLSDIFDLQSSEEFSQKLWWKQFGNGSIKLLFHLKILCGK